MGIGVDRLDYTKGILEKFLAVERLLEQYPRYQGVFTFVQIGAPSRTHIKRYHDLQAEIEEEADRINWRFQGNQWKPIVLLARQHNHREIQLYYRAADLCLVTSLHDGMNLVAKEFIAGIGNAYSDELLHAARMSPFKPASSLGEAELRTLYDAIRDVLGDAVARSRGLHASELKGEKKSHLAVHGRTGQPCPVCGDVVREVSFADSSLQYCPTCQTGGKPLADRRLSKLLK